MSTFENDLRLEEIGTGEQSGTWGATTNTNLELVASAFSYSFTGEAIANASTHTITMADGAADEFRSFYLKCTGGGQACTVTLAPNTLSKIWMIENTTSYTLTFSQGSGANVAVAAGEVKMIATDGNGSGAVVYDLFTDVNFAGTTALAALKLGGTTVSATAAELNYNDTGASVGTVVASKVVTVDANKDVSSFRNITLTGELDAGSLDISGDADIDGTLETDAFSIAGTTVSATAAELNYNATGVSVGTVAASKAVIADANKDVTGMRNLTLTGDLTVGGDDLTMGTNTSGMLLVADGTNFNPTAVSSLSEISTAANDDLYLSVDTSGGGLKKISRSTMLAGTGSSSDLANVVDDTSPQLGGNLDTNQQDIVTISNRDLDLAPNGTGVVVVRGNTDGGGTNDGAIKLNCSADSHGQTVKAQPHSASVTNTMILPAGANSTLVSLVSTDTLTNKTLTAPKINEDVAVTSTATELNILDGVTTTTAEINLIDGGTARGTTAVASGDGILINDAGTMRMTNVDTVSTYFSSHSVGGGNIVTTGALNSGSITSGFGAIDNGSSNITTTGVGSFGSLDISGNIDVDGTTNLDAVDIDGAVNVAADLTIASTNKILFNDASQFIQGSSATVLTIAATDEIDLTATTIDINGAVALNGAITGATNITLSGELDAATGDFSGDVDVDGTLEADAITIGGTAIGSIFSPIAGGTGIVTTGALDAGSITSGFGTINNGSSAITTTGVGTFGSLDISGNIDIDGTTNLDAVDIDGAVQLDATLTVGVNDTGYDVKFFGATASAFMQWDASADDLILGGAAGLIVPEGQFTLGSTAVTSTAAELNLVDGISAGTVSASKAVIVDSNKDLTGGRNLTISGELDAATLDISGNADIDGTLETDGLTVGGVAAKVAGKESIWVPAAAMYPSTTNGCSAITQVETTALRPDLKVLDFAAAADDFAQFAIAFPKSWNEGTVTYQPFWTVTGTNTGTVVWQLGGVAVSSDDTINTAFGTLVATAALAHSGTSNDLMVSAESGAVTIAGSPAANDLCFFQINNDASASGQTGVVRLLGVKFFFTTDAANDA